VQTLRHIARNIGGLEIERRMFAEITLRPASWEKGAGSDWTRKGARWFHREWFRLEGAKMAFDELAPDDLQRSVVSRVERANGSEIPMPVAQSRFVVNITMATEPGQKPTEFKVRPYEKIGGNGDGSKA
jgi:hypothetical protein